MCAFLGASYRQSMPDNLDSLTSPTPPMATAAVAGAGGQSSREPAQAFDRLIRGPDGVIRIVCDTEFHGPHTLTVQFAVRIGDEIVVQVYRSPALPAPPDGLRLAKLLPAGILAGDPVNGAVVFPDEDEPPYRTREEIERRVAAGVLAAEVFEQPLVALFLRPHEIAQLLEHVRAHAMRAPSPGLSWA